MALYDVDLGVRDSDRGILQPKLKNRWRIEFIGLGGATGGDQNPTRQAIQFERPKLSFEEVELHRYNSRAWIAGKHNFQPITVTFEDDYGSLVSRELRNQVERQQRLIAPERGRLLGAAAAGEDYKFTIKAIMLDGDYNGENRLETWDLFGCWCSNLDYGDMDYAANESVKVIATFRFDHANQTFTGGPKKATGGIIGPRG